MKSSPYNRKKEKDILKEFITKPSEKLIDYQIAYFTDEITGEWICVDEWFIKPEDEEMALSYIGKESYKVFANYEDGLQEELS